MRTRDLGRWIFGLRNAQARSVGVLATCLLSAFALAASATQVASAAVGAGDTGYYDFAASSEDGTVQVNVGSGSLLVSTTDLPYSEADYHVVLNRYYNSRAGSAQGILGARWTITGDPLTRVTSTSTSATLTGPSGYTVTLPKAADGSYTSPAGFEGTLSKTSSGWRLDRPIAHDAFIFSSSGALQSIVDSAGQTFTVSYTSAAGKTVLSSYGTSSGRRANISYNGDSRIREIDSPSSGHAYYAYTGGVLTTFTSFTGATTTYGYDSNGYLNRLTLPSGTVISTQNDSIGRVLSFTQTFTDGNVETTSFDYSAGDRTLVTRPGGSRYVYVYDGDYRVTSTYDPDPKPGNIPEDRETANDPDVSLTSFDLDEAPPTQTTCQRDPDLMQSDAYCFDDTSGGSSRAALRDAPPAGPASTLTVGGSGWGLADQIGGHLTLPSMLALGVHHARLIIPWDIVSRDGKSNVSYKCHSRSQGDDYTVKPPVDSYTLPEVDAYIQSAQQHGYDVTLSIGRTRYNDQTKTGRQYNAYCYLPSANEYAYAFIDILRHFTSVNNFTAWNEPNDAGQPTSRERNGATGPIRAAQYWKAAKVACLITHRVPCNVATPDFLDKNTLFKKFNDSGDICTSNSGNCRSYLGRFTDALKGAKPRVWAFHAYETGNRHNLDQFVRFRSYATGVGGGKEFWLTEQGGRTNVKVDEGAPDAHFQGTDAANNDLIYLLNALPAADARISKFFVYNYVGDIRGDRGLFDSGLTDYRWTQENGENVPRQMYCTYLSKTQVSPPDCTPDPRTSDPIPYPTG